LPDETHRDLSLYRLQKSERDLRDAKANLNVGSYDTAANRAYYSIFHAMRAVLALDKKDYSKHSAVISFFSKDYILTGAFDRGFGKTIRLTNALRNASDYDDYLDVTQEDANEAVCLAAEFHEAVKEYIIRRSSLAFNEQS
jgi:uncharacterized protein (UPF0332 family)